MKYIHRSLETKILELTSHFPIVAVLGARQVGKTTLVKHLPIDGLKTVTFDPVQDIGGAREDPDFFLQNQPRPLFLDEVQYAPELLASIKREVDRNPGTGQFILSGSQNLSVLRSVSESLAGRVAIIDLLPLSLAEIDEEPTKHGWLETLVQESQVTKIETRTKESKPSILLNRIWRGGMPGIPDIPDHLLSTYFNSYRQTYIERDVRAASERAQLQRFGRFFGLLAAYTAQEINHNQLGRELNIDRKTAVAWTDIAISTYQWHEVPAYSRNAVKRIAGKPKGYLVDTGLACHLQRIMSPDHVSQHPMAGQLFETLMISEILKKIAIWPQKPNLYHYRAYSGAEVDLILEQNGTLFPIEIKMASNPSKRDVRGFQSLKEAFPNDRFGRGLLICAIPEARQLAENVIAVPWGNL